MEQRFDFMGQQAGAKFIKRINNAGMVVGETTLPRSTQELVLLRVSQVNGCGFCVDMHYKDAVHEGEDPVRLNLVAAWREATVFTEAERAALAFAEESARLADAHRGVSDETWAQVRKHYDDDQIAGLIMVVALINAYNRINVITRTPAGGYVPGQFA
ncbi:carboxymuconolactone decarboxylase family protein [Nocardia farcinica]|uniref:carboxymuconolactone decarboxylase family protein n=1 Tax=Nocardia farcinica TaxID=37329 RepID=UPI0018943BE4|nr:carboxymuconolactone decarboxylase family protein [Nocardia farcinica]MBF6361044.1 carboxymuconolactone decarboxylase family protein [Nocardia farcinica]